MYIVANLTEISVGLKANMFVLKKVLMYKDTIEADLRLEKNLLEANGNKTHYTIV